VRGARDSRAAVPVPGAAIGLGVGDRVAASGGVPSSLGADATAGVREEVAGFERNAAATQSPGVPPPSAMLPPAPFPAPEPMAPPEPMLPPAPFLVPSPMLPPSPMPSAGAPPSGPAVASPPPAVSAPPAASAPPVARPVSAARPPQTPGETVRPVPATAPPNRARPPQPQIWVRPPARTRRRVKRVWLLVGVGLLILAGSAKFGLTTATTPAPAVQHSVSAQASHPSASAAAAGASASSSRSTPAPLTRAQRWLNGLTSLRRQMNNALPAGTVTRRYLRQAATTMRHCTPELAALGPPVRPLRPTYEQARRACAAFERGAGFAVAAERAYTVTASPSSRAGLKLTRLLNQTDAAVNQGNSLIEDASYGAPVFPGS
jgi:hypothetical protein